MIRFNANIFLCVNPLVTLALYEQALHNTIWSEKGTKECFPENWFTTLDYCNDYLDIVIKKLYQFS